MTEMAEDIISTDIQFQNFMDSMKPPLSEDDYELQLSSFKKLKKNKLPYIINVDHLANLSDASSKQLRLFIWNKRIAYCSFNLPKKRGGFRRIDAPSKKLKNVQRWILDNILYKLDAGDFAHGFVPNKSIVTNASIHVGQELVLGIDIKDFFPRITLNKVEELFNRIGYNRDIAHDLGELCTFNYVLPQGAPTSPMISNLIARSMDDKLSKFCEEKNFNYSRYADDITISGRKNLPRHKSLIFSMIKEEGFSINKEKVRISGRGSSQRVTGLVVNDKVTLGREKKKRLRAIVHNIEKNGPVTENRDNDPFFKEKIFGHLALAKMIYPDFGNVLLDSLKNVDWENYSNISKDLENSELTMRSFKRTISHPLIPFDELGFFKDIKKISQKDYTEELLNQLNDLREKCKPHPSKEECMDCLYKQNESYEKCIKYILAHFIGDTCGTHHGHEIYDIGGETILYGDNVFVGILAKSGLDDTQSKDSLLRQFFDCTDLEELNIISIATPRDLDSSLTMRINRIRRKFDENKRYCMILRKDMGRILKFFNMNYSNKSKQKELKKE